MSLLLSYGRRFQRLIAISKIKEILIEPCRYHGLKGKHILSVEMFIRDQLGIIFDIADDYKKAASSGCPIDVLKGKILATVFYEDSTRTRCSFAAAMQRLGGGVIYMDQHSSAVTMGETLEDSIRIMSSYSDVVVLKHPKTGACAKLCQFTSGKPLINGGDGDGEHPAQAIQDIYTIREECGKVDGMRITLVGDLKHGRAVHSLAKLVTEYEPCQLNYVCSANLEMPKDVKRYVEEKEVRQKEFKSLKEILPDTDILYMTRIVKEKFKNQDEYKKASGQFAIKSDMMCKAKKDMRVLHPLPRASEINTDFDKDPRAAYFRQAENGMYIRMALLTMVLGK